MTNEVMQMNEQPPELRPDVSELAQSEPFPWVGFIVWFVLVNLMFWYLTIGQYS